MSQFEDLKTIDWTTVNLAGKMVLVLGSAQSGKSTFCNFLHTRAQLHAKGEIEVACKLNEIEMQFDKHETLVLSTRAITFIHPSIRKSVDFLVLVGRQDKQTLRRVWDEYSHLFFDSKLDSMCEQEKFNLFLKAIDLALRNRTVLVLDISSECRQGKRSATMQKFASACELCV